jgi:hypothetical protein
VKCIQFCSLDPMHSTSGLLLSSNSEGSEDLADCVKWSNDGCGYFQLSTYDYRFNGAFLWLTFKETLESPMSTIAVNIMQIAGSPQTAYGAIFCHQDSNNFYRCLIRADGRYYIDKYVSGEWETIIPWTRKPTTGLRKNPTIPNTIAITRETTNNFAFYLNDTLEIQFSDNSFSGGRAGFCAYIGEGTEESLSDKSEDIRFKMDSPLTVPWAN